MSWTYDDDFNEACYKWKALPDGPKKDKLATKMLNRYLSIREHDCGWMRLPDAYPDWGVQRFPVKPAIPKELIAR